MLPFFKSYITDLDQGFQHPPKVINNSIGSLKLNRLS